MWVAESIAGIKYPETYRHANHGALLSKQCDRPYNGSLTAHVRCDHKFSSAILEFFLIHGSKADVLLG